MSGRFVLQVVYGSSIREEFDRQAVSAMIDYWISPAAVKREFEAAKSKCDSAAKQFRISCSGASAMSKTK